MKPSTCSACLVFLLACSGSGSDGLSDSLGSSDGGSMNDDAANEGDDAGGAADEEDAGQADGGAPEIDAGVNPRATVLGRVLGSLGEPLSDVTLRIGGQSVQTDAEGRFTADVRPPYDLAVTQDTSTYVFLDVERLDPTLHLPRSASARSARISGRVDGGDLVGFPLDTVTYVNVTFAGAPGFFAERLNPGDAASYGPFPVQWGVGDTLSGYLVAVATSYVGNEFTDPVAVAVSPLQLSDGVDVIDSPDTLLTLVEPATRTVQVDISLPADHEVVLCQKSLGTYSRALVDPGAAFAMSVVADLPAGLAQSLYCELRDGAGRVLQVSKTLDDETTVAFDPPVGVRALAPADGATLTAVDAFTFVPQPDAVSFVSFHWIVSELGGELNTDYDVRVATDGDSVPVARLTALGVDIAPATDWSVSAQGSWPSLDDYLGPDLLPTGERVSSSDLQRSLGDGLAP